MTKEKNNKTRTTTATTTTAYVIATKLHFSKHLNKKKKQNVEEKIRTAHMPGK